MAESKGKGSVAKLSPKQELGQEFQHLMTAIAGRAMSGATSRVNGLTDKLSGVADGSGPAAKAVEKVTEKTAEGKSPAKAGLAAGFEGVKEKVKGAFGGGGNGGKSSGGKKLKVTNIIEGIDIGAPVDVVYNQWTQFQDWSGFMKKLEDVEQVEDEKINFQAQVLWSHRSWEGRIVDQVPNERIVWRSKAEKGRVEGAVTFHELAPSLTRVLVVIEYYPQGFFEQTGNLWRAQGRRVRLELKHFRRHVMTQAMLHPDELEGWHGEIHDGEVTRDNEDAEEDSGGSDDQDADDEYDERDEVEEDDDEDQDREKDEYADDDEYDAEDEYDEGEEEDEEPSADGRARRRAGAGSR